MQRFPMTLEGELALTQELEQLKNVERPRIINDIAVAREHGDLKENAEYHAAREEQGFAEGRIAEIEGKLSNAQVIDPTTLPNDGKVYFGATVTLINVETEEEVIYKIVGEDEADIKNGKINVTSPIARALISKEQGDIALVRAPAGEIEYEIEKVELI